MEPLRLACRVYTALGLTVTLHHGERPHLQGPGLGLSETQKKGGSETSMGTGPGCWGSQSEGNLESYRKASSAEAG